MPSATGNELPEALPFPIGTLVRYHDNGWRAGYFEGMEKGRALVRPIRYGKPVRVVKLSIEELEPLER